jgi:hypothetical protein
MLDSSKAVDGTLGITAAMSSYILSGWAKSLGDEVRKMDPVGSVAPG